MLVITLGLACTLAEAPPPSPHEGRAQTLLCRVPFDLPRVAAPSTSSLHPADSGHVTLALYREADGTVTGDPDPSSRPGDQHTHTQRRLVHSAPTVGAGGGGGQSGAWWGCWKLRSPPQTGGCGFRMWQLSSLLLLVTVWGIFSTPAPPGKAMLRIPAPWDPRGLHTFCSPL